MAVLRSSTVWAPSSSPFPVLSPPIDAGPSRRHSVNIEPVAWLLLPFSSSCQFPHFHRPSPGCTCEDYAPAGLSHASSWTRKAIALRRINPFLIDADRRDVALDIESSLASSEECTTSEAGVHETEHGRLHRRRYSGLGVLVTRSTWTRSGSARASYGLPVGRRRP